MMFPREPMILETIEAFLTRKLDRLQVRLVMRYKLVKFTLQVRFIHDKELR